MLEERIMMSHVSTTSSSSSPANYLSEIKVTSSSKDSFTLEWEVRPEMESQLDGFLVHYRASGSIRQNSRRIDGKVRSTNIGHLHENTEYYVCLRALFLGSPATFASTLKTLMNPTRIQPSPLTTGPPFISTTSLTNETSPKMNAYLDFEESTKGPTGLIDDERLTSYCVKAFTGYNGAWVALGSALAATIVIGLIVFVVLLARHQNGSRIKAKKSKNQNTDSSEDQDRSTEKKRKWWLNGKCPVHKPECRLNPERGIIKKGFLANLKKKKRRGFRLKNQLHSSKSVVGCEIDANQTEVDQAMLCSCGQKSNKKSKKRRGEVLFGGRDENPSSVHSSLLSLIQDDPGNCYLVATATSSSEDQKQIPGTEEVTHELAYLIPIMKCQDGTFVLGTDPTKTEALLDNPLPEMLEEDEDEMYETEDDREPFDGDFDILPIVFHPECCLSVVDSLYVGDVIAIEDGEITLPGLAVSSEKGETSKNLQSVAPMTRRDSSQFSNFTMPKTDV